MSPRKLIKIVIVLAIAIAATILVNMRFPKYGNTESDIAHIASEKAWYNLLVTGSEFEVYAMGDFENTRIALVRPFDEEDKRFGFLLFYQNAPQKYEQRGSVIWCPNDMMQVFNYQSEEGSYAIALYNNPSIVLIQRTDLQGFVENYQVTVSNGITPWKGTTVGYTYNCVNSNGVKFPQKK